MHNDTVILAASYLNAIGYGNNHAGWQKWPAALAAEFALGQMTSLKWPLLFSQECERFNRMDWLCRLGVMATELLPYKFLDRSLEERDRTGVCVETLTGCISSDVRFLQTSSPNAFTYTLPSTLIGELCIRHKLRGPVLCQAGVTENPSTVWEAADDWLACGQADTVLCVAVEAVDETTGQWLPEMRILARPAGEPAASWWGAALLLGQRRSQTQEHLSAGTTGSLPVLCRQLCRQTPG